MEKIHLNGIASVGIAGLGLIGGSMARAVKTYTDCVVCGCDIDPAATEAALAQGAADRCAEDASVFTDSDVVFVALYPQQTIDFVKKMLHISNRAVSLSICAESNAVRSMRFPASVQNITSCLSAAIRWLAGKPGDFPAQTRIFFMAPA